MQGAAATFWVEKWPGLNLLCVGDGFEHVYCVEQVGVERVAIASVVGAAVTVGADACHVPGIVGPPITQTPNMMCLKVRTPIRSGERCRRFAGLTRAIGASEHIVSHVPAPAKQSDCAGCLGALRRCCRCQRSRTQFHQRRCRGRLTCQIVGFELRLPKRDQAENKRVALMAINVRLPLNLPAGAGEQALKPNSPAFLHLAEEQKVFAGSRVIADRSVAGGHPHVAHLTLSRVPKRAVSLEGIFVANDISAMPGKDEYAGRASRGRNSALLLSTERFVNVRAANVGLMDYIGPVHSRTMYSREGRCNASSSFGLSRVGC
jgi:hypothetical protein